MNVSTSRNTNFVTKHVETRLKTKDYRYICFTSDSQCKRFFCLTVALRDISF